MIIGVDLGGTKTAVIAANSQGEIFARVAFSTSSPKQTLAQVLAKVKSLSAKRSLRRSVSPVVGLWIVRQV